MLIMLDMAHICASSGSACTSGSLDPSHVLLAIGLPHEIAHGSLRLTLGDDNTQEEIDGVVDEIEKIVAALCVPCHRYMKISSRKQEEINNVQRESYGSFPASA